MEIKALVTKQRNYFRTQATKDINTRRQALKRLKAALREMEAEIHEALRKDRSAPQVYIVHRWKWQNI